MSAEGELLRRLQEALADADVDVERMVEAGWRDAQNEVAETLRRLMVRDLLHRAHRQLTDQAAADTSERTARQTHQAPQNNTESTPAAETVTYLYAVTNAASPLPQDLPELPGGGPVHAVDAAGLRAIVCRLDRRVLAELQEPSSDGLETLAAAAQAHDATLAACARLAAVLPLRLGTVVVQDSSVEELLEGHAAVLADELDRLAGHTEWSVTVHLLDRPPEPEAVRERDGRAYLQARQAALDAQEQRRQAHRSLGTEIHARLAGCVADARVVGAKPVPEIAPPLLHGVYLVHDKQHPAFDAAVEDARAQHPHARVDVTGPWPPYHFTDVRLGEDTDTLA